jgi:hypothetical protein
MKKKTVFFDFDDTMMETHPLLVAFLNQHYGIQIPLDIFLCGNSLDKVVNNFLPPHKAVSAEQLYEDYSRDFLGSRDWHDKAVPMEGACRHIPRLAARYNLWIVTARDDSSRPLLKELCKKFFGGHITGMHFVWKRVGVCDFKVNQTKCDFIAGFPGEKIAFFDDNPNEALKTDRVIKSFLYDPHRHHDARTDIAHRVHGWDEIASLLLS